MIEPKNNFPEQLSVNIPAKLEQRILLLKNYGWSLSENTLKKDYSFTNFKAINLFLEKLTAEILQQNHHPFFQFNPASKLCTISLTTHDIGNKVSEKDVLFAENLESFCKKLESQSSKKP